MKLISVYVVIQWNKAKCLNKGLAEAAENYHVVIAENRKLYNEVQDLKGMHYMVLIWR